MAITTPSPAAYCLDLTRLVSRVGLGPLTGIDRVELAYFSRFLSGDALFFCLVKLRFGYALLDRAGAQALYDRMVLGARWGGINRFYSLGSKRPRAVMQAQADIRRFSVGRARSGGLARLLKKHLPNGTEYFNVGHSNLSEKVLVAIKSLLGGRISVLVHDTIPLDFPQFQRPEIPEKFKIKLQAVGAFADRVISTSAVTGDDIRRHLSKWGRVPEMLVAHLGLSPVHDYSGNPHENPPIAQPYFITLGTIEPRKNHTLLLDIWDRLAKSDDPFPGLVIVGRRGWKNQSVFERLDEKPAGVVELNDLPDRDVWALMSGAAGLLFPSHCEGFGLPAAEAAVMGVPVICSDLPVFREILGNYPVYADVADLYSWETKINNFVHYGKNRNNKKRRTGLDRDQLSWNKHFENVLN
ncbi:MAG: glycosyltransferase family 4 protein [Marinosulfonomonas sp.]|nr:glycosyltransferase family 4 protein [Marinosulfonomonas sp.]